MSSSRTRSRPSDLSIDEAQSKDKRMSSIFSMFSSSSRKSSIAHSTSTGFTSVEPSPTERTFPRSSKSNPNRKSGGSQISTSQLQIPHIEASSLSHSSRKSSPSLSLPPSPAQHRGEKGKHVPSPLSPTSAPFPLLETQTRLSPTTIPSQRFLTQMPLSLAFRTAVLATQ